MSGDDFDLADAYAVETPDDNRRLYARWAESYDDGFLATHGYVYHRSVVEVLQRRLGQTDGAILDVGCGTGVVGIELRSRGYEVVDGVDLSPEMLAVAATKTMSADSEAEAVYRTLIEADLTRALPLTPATYAGLISAGTFTHGHLGPEPIGRLIELLMPGASAAIGVNGEHFESHGFRAELERLETAGAVVDVELVIAPMYDLDDYVAEDADHATLSSTVVLMTKP